MTLSTQNSRGFTLAELLITVAIIGVLVAISIPVFASQTEKSREATDLSNCSCRLCGSDGGSDHREYGISGEDCPAEAEAG